MPTKALQRIFSFTFLVALVANAVLPAVAMAQTVTLSPYISSVEVTRNPFDPTKETTTFTFELENSSANVAFYIYDPDDGSTSPIRILSYGSSKSVGTYSYTWWGDYENDDLVPANTYEFEIVAWNPSTGLSDTYLGEVTVAYDSSNQDAPVISNDYASPSTINPDDNETTTISWQTDVQAETTLEILDDNGNTVRTLIDENNQTGGSKVWNGANDSGYDVEDGSYTYKITACNTTYTNLCDTETGLITVKRESSSGNEPNITNDYATPNPFDPYDETTRIYYTLDRSADVTVEIYDGSYRVVTLVDDVSRSSGTRYETWDGEDEDNDVVSDDTYTYKITACNSYGCDYETGNVEVDTNGSSGDAPNITNDYASPNPFDPDSQEGRIYFTLDRSADVTVEIYDGSYRVVTLWDDISRNSGQSYVDWDGDDEDGDQVNDDTYEYKITACNSYGCDTEKGNIEVDSDNNNGNDDDLIDDVHVNNEVFDPEDDERAQLCFDILQDNTEILVQVMDGNHVVDTLINYVDYDETNNKCVYWDGEDDDNDIVDDDVYQFRIRAERGNDTQVEYAYTEVDTDGRIIGFPDDGDCGGYTDVDPDSPFCRAIALLNFRGVFTGYPDGTFRPYQVINRAETVKVNMLALDYDILDDDYSNLGFWDVQRGSWYMPYLRTARRYGVINGYPDSSFRPNYSVNRVELLKIFLEATDINLPHCNVAPYPDTPVNYETRWYIDYACFAKAFGLMRTDGNGNFNPDAPMTRADVADLFYQFEMRGLFGDPNWDYYNNYYNTYNSNYYYSPTYPIYYY